MSGSFSRLDPTVGEDPTAGEVGPHCMNKPNTGTQSQQPRRRVGNPLEALLSKAVMSTAGTPQGLCGHALWSGQGPYSVLNMGKGN